jgi:hypothetical protein
MVKGFRSSGIAAPRNRDPETNLVVRDLEWPESSKTPRVVFVQLDPAGYGERNVHRP